jgi:hypothetical protein
MRFCVSLEELHATSLIATCSLLLAEASDPYVEDSFGHRPQDVAANAETKAAFGSTFVKTVVDAMHVTIDNLGPMHDIKAQVHLQRVVPHDFARKFPLSVACSRESG